MPTGAAPVARKTEELCPAAAPTCPLQISFIRKRLQAMGADTRLMGSLVENHDTDRFLTNR